MEAVKNGEIIGSFGGSVGFESALSDVLQKAGSTFGLTITANVGGKGSYSISN